MSASLDCVRNGFLILVGVSALYFLVRFLFAGFHIIDEGQSAVIERLGRFVRMSGPGPVWVTPRLERIARILETRTTGEVYAFTDVWFQGFLPFTIELALSYRLNLKHLPRALRKDLAYYTRDEWRTLTKAHITRVLQDILPNFQFVHLIGRSPACRSEFETMLRNRLQESLRRYGMSLSDYHDVELKAVRLPEPLQESLTNITRIDIDARTRSAVIDNIIKKYPDLSEASIVSIASLLTGQELGVAQILPPIIFQGATEARTARQIRVEEPPQMEEQIPPQELERPDDTVWRILKLPPGKREETC